MPTLRRKFRSWHSGCSGIKLVNQLNIIVKYMLFTVTEPSQIHGGEQYIFKDVVTDNYYFR